MDVVLTADPKKTLLAGRVGRATVAADGAFPVGIEVEPPRRRGCSPGFTVKVKVTVRDGKDAVTVPVKSAWVADGDERFVHVLGDDGKPGRRDVEVGDTTDGRIEIVEGLVGRRARAREPAEVIPRRRPRPPASRRRRRARPRRARRRSRARTGEPPTRGGPGPRDAVRRAARPRGHHRSGRGLPRPRPEPRRVVGQPREQPLGHLRPHPGLPHRVPGRRERAGPVGPARVRRGHDRDEGDDREGDDVPPARAHGKARASRPTCSTTCGPTPTRSRRSPTSSPRARPTPRCAPRYAKAAEEAGRLPRALRVRGRGLGLLQLRHRRPAARARGHELHHGHRPASRSPSAPPTRASRSRAASSPRARLPRRHAASRTARSPTRGTTATTRRAASTRPRAASRARPWASARSSAGAARSAAPAGEGPRRPPREGPLPPHRPQVPDPPRDVVPELGLLLLLRLLLREPASSTSSPRRWRATTPGSSPRPSLPLQEPDGSWWDYQLYCLSPRVRHRVRAARARALPRVGGRQAEPGTPRRRSPVGPRASASPSSRGRLPRRRHSVERRIPAITVTTAAKTRRRTTAGRRCASRPPPTAPTTPAPREDRGEVPPHGHVGDERSRRS